MQDKWAVLRYLHRLCEVLHRLPHVDERMARVVEDPEAPVHAQIDAGRLDHPGVERVDHDPPAFDFRADGAVAEYHAAAIVMTDSESTCPWGRDRPSWAPHADETDSSAIGDEVGGDPAPTWRVSQGCGDEESVIF